MVTDDRKFDLGEALARLESVEPSSVTAGFDVVALLEPMLTCAEAEKNEEAVRRLNWERFLFSLQPMPLWTENPGKYRLVCMLSFKGRDDEMARMPKEALVYFTERLATCKNSILRARYADVLWDRRDDSGLAPMVSAEHARTACNEYLSAAEAALRTPRGRLNATVFLNRAISIGIQLGDSDICRSVVSSALAAINRLGADPEFRGFAGGLAETLLKVRTLGVGKDAVSGDVLTSAAEVLEKAAGAPLKTLDLTQYCLGLLARLYEAIGESALANRAKERLASTWIFQADFLQPAMLWQSDWFERAANLYREAGNRERIGELMRRSRLANRDAVSRGEYKTIAAPVVLDAHALEQIHARYLQKDDVAENLRILTSDDSLIPTADDARQAAAATLDSNTLYARIHQSAMKGDRKAIETRDNPERQQFEASQELRKQVTGLVFFVISPALARLSKEGGLSHTTLTEFLVGSAAYPDSLSGLVAAGSERYFAGDLTSTIYLLTPALEGVIRETLMRNGIDVTPPKGGGYRESTLGAMLAKPETELLFGKRVRDHLRFALTDEDRGGMNLRNDVAHAIIGPGQCDQTLTDLLVYLHLLMTRFGQT